MAPNGDTPDRKRKWNDSKQSLQHGSRNRDRQGRDLGRKEFGRQKHDKRTDVQDRTAKRIKTENADGDASASSTNHPFSKEEIEAESRKPKHKVAVMIGYSGTGYKGMQINITEKTIEGDLFAAFIAAGVISKANADDPKKSSLVRCARTDKGVHAAGNVISLKLIVEDADVVSRINSHLSPQIRVWGIQRTVNSFSCYQACDSRYYEYLIPSHAFLPPHPSSFLGKKLVSMAETAGDLEQYKTRQAEVADFWTVLEANDIKPILETMEESVKELVLKALYDTDEEAEVSVTSGVDAIQNETTADQQNEQLSSQAPQTSNESVDSSSLIEAPTSLMTEQAHQLVSNDSADLKDKSTGISTDDTAVVENADRDAVPAEAALASAAALEPQQSSRKQAVEAAVKLLRDAYITAKRAYRIPKERLDRIDAALQIYVGTKNFHNYTINKAYKDASAKRHIKSFTVDRTPIVIDGTEWLSLKIHGQSFMMHQIRKMVSMVALTVRCGCPIERINETLGPDIVSIPKAPGLGLLLERPVFDSYNEGAATKFSREKIDFGKYEKDMEEFKRREIYQRIFTEEEQSAAFQVFFNQIDVFREPQFLYLSSQGMEAVKNIPKTRSTRTKTVDTVTGGFESDEEGGLNVDTETG